jgi:hypothetical protein
MKIKITPQNTKSKPKMYEEVDEITISVSRDSIIKWTLTIAITLTLTIYISIQFIGQTPTPITTTPIPDTRPVNRIESLERIELEADKRDTYTRTLSPNEAIVGDAVDVEGRGEHCVVFWYMGPGEITFEMLNGAWNRYTNVTSQSLQEQVDARHNYLQNEHWYCKTVTVPVVELGS